MRQAVRLTERISGNYEHVWPILRLEFDHVFRAPLAEVRVQVGASSISRRVQAQVGPASIGAAPGEFEPRTLTVPIWWRAADHPGLFPTLAGEIRVRNAGAGRIELRLTGEYTPPLGAIGAIADRFAGHQAATASLRADLLDVARRLEAELAEHPPAAGRRTRLAPAPHTAGAADEGPHAQVVRMSP